MKLLKGSATDSDGARVPVMVSQQRTLLRFADGTFAVRENYYRSVACPYLVFGAAKRFTVSIEGHSHEGFDDSVTANFRPFHKSDLLLPNTCIGSAEHALKCIHANAHSVAPIGDGTGARVSMSIGDRRADIDEEDMNEFGFATFPHGLDNAVDATLEGFEPGDGMALVYSRDPARRGRKWTVHAVAVLLKSTYVWDPFVVVSEVFAPDDGSDERMTDDWALACYSGAQDFKDSYFQVMSPKHYTFWKLRATPR